MAVLHVVGPGAVAAPVTELVDSPMVIKGGVSLRYFKEKLSESTILIRIESYVL